MRLEPGLRSLIAERSGWSSFQTLILKDWMLAPQTVEHRKNLRLPRAVGRQKVMTTLCNIPFWSWRGLMLTRVCFSPFINKLTFTSGCQEWGKREELVFILIYLI